MQWLIRNRGVLDMILFLAAINLIASVYSAALLFLIIAAAGVLVCLAFRRDGWIWSLEEE